MVSLRRGGEEKALTCFGIAFFSAPRETPSFVKTGPGHFKHYQED
jgi:hypothetical protein